MGSSIHLVYTAITYPLDKQVTMEIPHNPIALYGGRLVQ